MPVIDLSGTGGISGGGGGSTPSYPEVVITDGTTATGWVNGAYTPFGVTTIAGESCIRTAFTTSSTTAYTQYLRFNPASPVALNGRPTVRVRHAWGPVSLTYNESDAWELVVSSAANFAGTVVTFPLPSGLQGGAFIDYDIDVSTLTTVGCVGIRWNTAIEYEGGTATNTPQYISDISLPDTDDPPLISQATVYGEVKRLADFPGFVNTGDVTASLSAILGSLQPGDIFEFEPFAIYEISAQIRLDLHDVEIRFNNACFYIDGVFNEGIIRIGRKANRVTLKDPRVYGKRETTTPGSLLPDVNANMARYAEIPNGQLIAAYSDWASTSNCLFAGGVGGGLLLHETEGGLSIIAAAAGDMVATTATAKRYPALPAVGYTAQYQVNSFAAHFSRTITMSLVFYNSGGTEISRTAGTPITSPIYGTNYWLPITVTATAPALTTSLGLSITILGAASVGESHVFDRLILKRTTVPTNTISISTKTLASCGDGVKIKGNGTVGRQQFWARRPDGTNLWGFTLSGSADQTAGALARIIDLRTGVQQHATYLNVTTTPTLVTFEYTPTDIEAPLEIHLLNASTVTPITVTVTSSYEWGRSAYNGAGDNMSAITLGDDASDIRIVNLHAEGVQGDGFECTGQGVHNVKVEGIVSRCCCRQGLSVNSGYNIDIDDAWLIGTGRSGIDIEPYGSDWSVRKLSITRARAAYCVNSAVAMTNWHLVTELTLDLVALDCGGGLMTGGCDGGTFNLRNITTALSATSTDALIVGRNMRGVIHASRGVSMGSTTGVTVADANGVFSTVFPSSNPDLRIIAGNSGTPFYGFASAITDNAGVPQTLMGGIHDDYIDPTMANTTATVYSGIIRADDPDVPMVAFDPGPAKRWWPNTFKGPITRNLHYLGGLDLKAEPIMRTRGVSATATRANNLRGIATAVTTSATTLAVTFPGLGVACTAVFDTPSAAVGTAQSAPNNIAGAIANGTYYYKIAEILERGRGPSVPTSAIPVTLSGSNDVVRINTKGLVRPAYNGSSGYLPWGWTVYRGPSSTSFDTQYDVLPVVEFPSLTNSGQVIIDYGTNARVESVPLTDRWWGWPTTVAAVAHTGNAVDQSGWEPDTSYGVQITPSWSTTCWVTAKARGGFTINFGTAAPASATVDWFLVR